MRSFRVVFGKLIQMTVLTVVLFACMVADGEEGATDTTAAIFDHVTGGITDSRDRLRSGSFRILGELHVSSDKKREFDGAIEIYCAFDLDSEMVRFEKTSPVWRIPPHGVESDAVSSRQTLKFIKSDGKFTLWTDEKPFATRDLFRATGSTEVGFFDVRLVGLVNWETLCRDDATFERYKATIEPPSEALRESESVFRLTWVRKSIGSRQIVWFDETKGMSPVRSEIHIDGAEPSLGYRSTVSWTQINSVWVPVSAVHDSLYRENQRLQHEFVWESVNDPVEPSVFEVRDLNLPDRIRVYDVSSGKGTFVRDGSPEEDVTKLKQLVIDAPAFPNVRRPIRLKWLLIVNGLIVMSICGIWLTYWFRSSRK